MNCQFRQVECGACSSLYAPKSVVSHRSTCRSLLDYDGHVFTYNRSGLQETWRFPPAHYVELFAARLQNCGFAVGDRLRSELLSILRMFQDPGRYEAAQETLVQYFRCNGFFYWKLSHFSSLQAEASQGVSPSNSSSIWSSPFYASDSRRYKMRLRLDINGYEEGYNSHMSLFLEIMKGDYDSILTWNLEVEVAFTMLNMTESDNYTRTVRLQFVRPTSKYKFDGLKQFIVQQMVLRFVLNDTVFIKCEVKVI